MLYIILYYIYNIYIIYIVYFCGERFFLLMRKLCSVRCALLRVKIVSFPEEYYFSKRAFFVSFLKIYLETH